MLPRGTKVRKELEFFAWEGWVVGDIQTRGGTRMVAVEIDQEASGMAPSREVQIFCSTEDKLKVVSGVRLTDYPNPRATKELELKSSKY